MLKSVKRYQQRLDTMQLYIIDAALDCCVFLQPSGFAPGVNVNLSRTPTARHLLQVDSSDGVNMTITITAPASQMHDLANLVQSVVQSSTVRRQLQEAGGYHDVMTPHVVHRAWHVYQYTSPLQVHCPAYNSCPHLCEHLVASFMASLLGGCIGHHYVHCMALQCIEQYSF